MATETKPQPQGMPYGIGRVSTGWLIAIVVYIVLIGIGAYAYSRQVAEGDIVTGMRDLGTGGGAPWGLYIAFELWFVGIGCGSIILMALIRLLNIEHLRPLSRALGITGLATLFIGGWSLIVDVGQPVRAVVNIIRYARPMSPFFGTATFGLVAAFAATIVYLYLDSRRDAAVLARRRTRWAGYLRLIAAGYSHTGEERRRRRRSGMAIAIAVLVIGVLTASFSAFVFGIQQGRPGWFSSLQAPGFVVLALVTGAASAIVVGSVLRVALGERRRLNLRVFAWLSNLLMAATIVYLYFMVVELLTASYSVQFNDARVTESLIRGGYAWLFWLTFSLFLVAAAATGIQALSRQYSLWLIVAAAVLANIAALGKRVLLVVPPLTRGKLLPYADGTYAPTWVEYAVVIGLVALGAAVFMLFMKVFPIMEVEDDA